MVARMSAYENIKQAWQGPDLPNNSEILEAAERYRAQCEKAPGYYGLPTGSMSWVDCLAILVARSPREVWAPLFNRPVDVSEFKRQGM